jgi:hypothetical protein
VERCWAAASPQDMASNGAASMPTRAVATENRAMISFSGGAVRQQILRRDCEANQCPAAGSAVSMQSFLRFKAGAATTRFEFYHRVRPISAEMSHAIVFARQLLPKPRGSR